MTLTTLRTLLPAQGKGIILTFASAACISVTFVASKQALLELSPLAFTPVWFAVASLWGIGFYLLRSGPKLPTGLSASTGPILLLGSLNSVANLLFFTAINLGDPTLVAFFSRSETVYSVLLGAWFLGERMYRYQWVGVAIAIAGAGVMTFQAGPIAWLVLLILLVSTLFLSFSRLIAKKNVATVEPLILSTARTVLMSLMLGLAGLVFGQLAWPSSTAWLWIIGGSFFGPFLSYVLFYKGLLYLDLAKGSVIRATQPLFVAVYSLILFGTFITGQQFIGGMMMIAGVVLMLWQRQKNNEAMNNAQ
ncbi:DMT family transporter [Chloroflexota bacterium]